MILKNRDTQEEYNSILDCLEQTEEKYRYKTAVSDTKLSLTWHELAVMARKIGSGLSRLVPPGSPVPVFMEKVQLHWRPCSALYMPDAFMFR